MEKLFVLLVLVSVILPYYVYFWPGLVLTNLQEWLLLSMVLFGLSVLTLPVPELLVVGYIMLLGTIIAGIRKGGKPLRYF